MRIEIPEKANYIIKTIQAAGFEAFVVGGCVRDSILGRVPGDWDITTSAKPEQVKELFQRTIDTGIQHGTVTVMLEKEGFEVTTYRIDGEYEDSRHPKEVIFTPNLTEDLKRRDFTINAMAYNDDAGLIDIFGGIDDINARIIRCVGEARERFSEDALRMMRAVRFSAQLDYEIEEKTAAAIKELAPTLKNISAERIQVELVKMMTSNHPEKIRDAYRLGITEVFFPEFDKAMETEQNHPHHMYSVGEHIIHSVCNIDNDKILRLSMLLHDIGKPNTLVIDEKGITHFHDHPVVGEAMAKEILKRLKFDNDTIRAVSRLVRYHDYGNGVEPTMKIVRRGVNLIGDDIFPLLFTVRRADVCAQSMYMHEEKMELIDKWEACYQEILKEGQCVSLKTLALSGKDLIDFGIKPGPELGEALNHLLEIVLDNPEYNTREKLLNILSEIHS